MSIDYAYSVEKGKKLALDSLSRTKLVTEGYQLRTNGLSDLPDDLRNRVFSINYNIDSSSTSKDVTTTINGHRYLTPAKIEDKTDVFNSIVPSLFCESLKSIFATSSSILDASVTRSLS